MPIAAFDRVPKYFGEFLSENIIETPEGYRICKNVVIARTGFQTYKVREIDDPQGLLEGYQPSDEIELWRDPDEVFSDATIASFEGKPVTLQHPDEMLDLDSATESQRGHLQNVRKGKEPLEDGNLPLLGDFFITNPEAVQAIDDGLREVSCGYYYTLAKTGERYDQTNIRGNHAAIVQKARAGDEARIYDSAPEPEQPPIKEKPVSLRSILARGFQAFAKDAKPEEVEEALEEFNKEAVARSTNGNGSKGGDRHRHHRSKAKDAESASPSASASDSASASAEPARDDDVLKHPETVAPRSAFDAAHRQRLHDALDRVIEEHATKDAGKEDAPSLDAEMEELKDLFGEEEPAEDQSSSSEEEIPAQLSSSGSDSASASAEDAGEEAEVIGEEDAQEEETEEDTEEVEGEDEAKPVVREEPVLKPNERQKKAFDSNSIRLTRKVLIGLKPFVAAAKSPKLEKAFDTAFRGLRKIEKSGKTHGSYAKVREATRHTTAEDMEQDSPAQKESKSYEASMKEIMDKSRERFKVLTARK